MINRRKYNKILNKCSKISIIKNADYGDANLLEFGLYGILIRLSDKYNRLKTLILNNKNPLVKNETINDTLLDMINYCIYMILLSEKNGFIRKIKNVKRKR
jgi:hypothetical protein